MFENLFSKIKRVHNNYPALNFVKPLAMRLYHSLSPQYPRILKDEVKTVVKTLKSCKWNMNSGSELVHRKLEEEFASYIGSRYAIAVNTGGMGIQMALRALGIKPGDEVIHQVDTCVADAFAIINAGATPIFSDISLDTFMLLRTDLINCITKESKVIMPVHMWGNPENLDMVMDIANRYKLFVIEDACLAFGAERKGKKVGSIGTMGVFSFGSTKPIQAGEGGMIVTNDESLARELRTIRGWGEMTAEYGIRDQRILSWNGRMSEIVAALMLEQVRGYPEHLNKLIENVIQFKKYINNIDGIEVVESSNNGGKSIYAQVVTMIDEKILGLEKKDLMHSLKQTGVSVWHSNFEPIASLSFFKEGTWRDWYYGKNIERVAENYNKEFINSKLAYTRLGLGFMKNNFTSRGRTKYLINALDRILKKRFII